MRNSWRALIPVAFIASSILVAFPASAQEPDPVATWQTLVNEARLDEGLAPYGFSTLLAAAAQRHADDLAANQITSHIGSDGSTARQRVADAGYAAWTWNGGGSVAGENFWTGYSGIEEAMSFFLEDPAHRDNILSASYREIGVGVAVDADGRSYYVLDFGARPNVLPLFINDGAASTDDMQVAIRLTNEEVRPGGEGAVFMGRAIDIRISDEPDFNDLPWQPWEPLVPWTLPDTPGLHTVYVQLRDAAGRTAASTDTIVLGEGAAVEPTPVPPSPTPEPSATPVPPSPTLMPQDVVATPVVVPTTTLPLVATPGPELSPTAASTPTPYVLQPTPIAVGVTPFPTWTPLPTDTPPEEPSAPDASLGLLLALQGLALIFGLYLVLHRERRR
jgi:hypothetical protein